jgi:hypothetical protein
MGDQDAVRPAVRLVPVDDRASGPRLIAAERRFSRPMIELADLVTKAELDRIHPYVRDFYEDPSDFDVVVRLHIGPLLEQLVRGALSISPFYALGLLASKSEGRAREYPVAMRIADDAADHVRWDSLLVVDGKEVPLFTGTVSIVDGCLRQTLDGYGPPITLDLRARAAGDGVRFELARATPMLLFAAARISYTTQPVQSGIRVVCSYQHKLLRVDRQIELEAKRNAARSATRDRRVPGASATPRPPPTLLPPARRRSGS